MKRRRVHKLDDELTVSQIEFLLCGLATLQAQPFDSYEDIRTAWLKNRDFLLSLRDIPVNERIGRHVSYKSGCRPAGWWWFEQNTAPPMFEFRELDRLGMIDATELAAAAGLALAQWHDWIRQYSEQWQALARGVPVEELLRFFPEMPDIDSNGKLFWWGDKNASKQGFDLGNLETENAQVRSRTTRNQ